MVIMGRGANGDKRGLYTRGIGINKGAGGGM